MGLGFRGGGGGGVGLASSVHSSVHGFDLCAGKGLKASIRSAIIARAWLAEGLGFRGLYVLITLGPKSLTPNRLLKSHTRSPRLMKAPLPWFAVFAKCAVFAVFAGRYSVHE